MGLAIIGVLFLSGCATIQIMEKSLLQSPPSFIVIGDIIPANEKVKIPLEKIEEGQKIVFETFKKELPEFRVFKNIQDLPQGVEDYLLVETKIRLYREKRPLLATTIVFATAATSAMEAEMTVTKYKEKVVALKFPASSIGGIIFEKSFAYTQGLMVMATRVARTINKHARK